MHIVPSTVVTYIDKAYPDIEKPNVIVLSYSDVGFVTGLEALLNQIDSILLPTGEERGILITCRATMMSHVRMWETQGNTAPLKGLRGRIREGILKTIRNILIKCPDEPISKDIREFEFVSDESMRTEFQRDMGSIDFLVHQQQWKPAMVLAGALMEAILFDQITGINPQAIETSRKKAGESNPDQTRWHLPTLVKVGADLNILRDTTKKQCELSGDFRNLIHPGKAVRDAQKCTLATTLSVIAGLQLVLEDVRNWCESKRPAVLTT